MSQEQPKQETAEEVLTRLRKIYQDAQEADNKATKDLDDAREKHENAREQSLKAKTAAFKAFTDFAMFNEQVMLKVLEEERKRNQSQQTQERKDNVSSK